MKFSISNAILLFVPLAVMSCSTAQNEEGLRNSTDTTTTASSESASSPEGSDWYLVELGGQPVADTPTSRRPYLRLDPDGNKLVGSGGCNRLMGSYELNGQSLRFPMVGSTKMACSEGMEVESGFMKALESTASFAMRGGRLELRGSDGSVLGLLEKK